ncbi:MAG: hypothetical protein WKG32_17290 [Gemmatimonadaceae bacterium]
MPLSNNLATDPTLRAALARDVDDPASPDTRRLAEYIATALGPATAAVIHYGSRAQQSGARPESAHDFFVIVDRYGDAYRSLYNTVGPHFRLKTAIALARVLPPNVLRIVAQLGDTRMQAKCAVLSQAHLERLCSPRAPDHFTQGRLFQHVQLVWTRDEASRDAVVSALVAARAGTFDWGRPYLPAEFDTETYCRVLLETSFAAEIRPEGNERVAQLLAAQQDTLARMYGELLQRLASTRIVKAEGKIYRLAEPVPSHERLRVRLYFARSKARATARWGKHIALYDDWLEYIVQKIARRTGQTIELTARERRWPLLFVWPKALRFIFSRPQRTRAVPPVQPPPRDTRRARDSRR